MKRARRKCGINTYPSIRLADIKTILKACYNICNYFGKTGQRYRTRHQNIIIQISKDKGDEEAEGRILAIVSTEK